MKKSILFLGLCMLALNANAQTFGGKSGVSNSVKATNVEMAKPKAEQEASQPHVLSLIKNQDDFNYDDYLTQNLKTSNGEKLNCKKQDDVVICVDKNQKPFTGVATGTANNAKMKFIGHANYKNGMLNGVSKIVYESGNVVFESKYVNGKREGVAVTYSDKGYKQSETNYKNGKKDGRFVAYFPNGAKMVEANYKNDKAEGAQRVWHPNGKLQSQSRFTNDVIDGNATTYYTNGKLETQRIYKNGKENGVMKIYDDKTNKVAAEIPYVDGKIHGMLTVYNDGIPFNKMRYENGINNGEYIFYHQNGKKFIEATAKNDKLEGEAKIYDPTGKLNRIEYYKDGKKIK
ncbi:MAG: toxin-antitoxin system YwqK family antitoxin [Alphaproteobacteria bacterium]|nr:toxin-antitoxin system YwqK family antitoxin [Alphaproteobacteria bacterium]